MKMKHPLALLSCLLLALAGCTTQIMPTATSQPPASNPTKSPSPTIELIAPVTATLSPSATSSPQELLATPTSEPKADKLPHYTLYASLNYSLHNLRVEQQIDYLNRSGDSLSELLLLVEPARYPGVFQLDNLNWGDGSPVVDYSRDLGIIQIPLESPLLSGEEIALSLTYTLDLPSPSPEYYGRPVPFGYSSRQINLVDWYPFIPPYIPGEGWLYHQAGPFGEHLVYEIADFDVHIQIADSNPNIVIAASSIPETTEDGDHYRLESARNFSWSVSDQYVVSSTTIDSVEVFSYYFPINSAAGEAVLQTTAESLELFNELFGPYPRQVLTVVEADFLDGMEYDGLYFLSKGFYNLYTGSPADYLTAIAAHETAHQWWYAAVGNDQALEPWLDEALCTYSEHLYYEKLHPDSLTWWWTYRINYYEPQGWVDGSIYNPLGYRAYRDAVYLNGALFLDELRNTMGDDNFLDFLLAYSQKYFRQIVTGDDFFTTLVDYNPGDIEPLLDKFFQSR